MVFDEIERRMRNLNERFQLQSRIQSAPDAGGRGLSHADSRVQGAAESLYRGQSGCAVQPLGGCEDPEHRSVQPHRGHHHNRRPPEKIVREKTMPQSRSEKEIAGYRDVLATIHESHDYIPPKPTVILQLHRDLYKYSVKSIGGSFKNSDNVIAEELPDGRKIVRFEPVSAWETPGAMESLCDAFQTAAQDAELDPLLLIPIFILDFLCIHPFNEGNGRMSRLLTLLLLYRSGYLVGKYISIEKLISDTKETYYEALQESSCNWHEGTNDYAPFVTYMLGVLAAAYRDFESRIELLTTKGLSKPDRVREIIKNHLGKITKSEIMTKCPDISQITVQRALAELLKSGEIIKLSGGRYTAYVWSGEETL